MRSAKWLLDLLSWLTMLLVIPSLALAACPKPRDRLPLHQQAADATLANWLNIQGKAPLPPATKPPYTLAGWASATRAKLSQQLPPEERRNPATVLFIFKKRALAEAGPSTIPASNEDFWCLVRVGDNVVLLDRTSHMTPVFAVDHDEGAIYFIDPWPEHFLIPDSEVVPYSVFIRKYNEQVYQQFADKKLVKISWEQFQNAVAWSETMDSPNLWQYYFQINQKLRVTPKLVLRLELLVSMV